MPFTEEHRDFEQRTQGQSDSLSHVSDYFSSLSPSSAYFQVKTEYEEDYNLLQFSNFVFPEPPREEVILSLPFGWKITGRKKSIFEVETNIRTLGELCDTLVELRSQLPDEQPEEIVQQTNNRRSSSLTASEICATLSRSQSSNSNLSCHSVDEPADIYDNFISTYPNFLLVSLLELYNDNCCGYYANKKDLAELFQLDQLNKPYACAIFASSALHATFCHPDKFGIYSFLNELASDAYYVAHELIEFDSFNSVSIETLVVMHQFLMLLGREGEARNLFCLAWRQLQLLEKKPHRFFLLWMAEIDWSYAVSKGCGPIVQYSHVKRAMRTLKSKDMADAALKHRLKGLYITLTGTVEQLNQWRTKYLDTFLYKRHQSNPYNVEDKQALYLHAQYFSNMLQLHQQQMMAAFEKSTTVQHNWTDYFISTNQSNQDVEKSLYKCMNSASGFVHVVKLLLEEKDICQLPHMVDTLSAAYTILYFGNKVMTAPYPHQALRFVVNAFSESSLMQCARIHWFVQSWGFY